jgi:hypothetical protein
VITVTPVLPFQLLIYRFGLMVEQLRCDLVARGMSFERVQARCCGSIVLTPRFGLTLFLARSRYCMSGAARMVLVIMGKSFVQRGD